MTSTVYVYTLSRAGQVGAWSRYTFPFSVDYFAQLGNDLYIRHGDTVSKVVESAVADEVGGAATNFTGTVWWNWLDFGSPGVTKRMQGFDVVASGTPSLAIGYDQRSTSAFTTPYAIDPDTLPGGGIPMEVSAPTFSVKMTFAGGEKWTLTEVLLYLSDNRAGTV